MIFITKKQFECEMRERVEKELAKFFENQGKQDRERELHQRIGSLELRLEKVEEKCGIPTNVTASCFVI